jgi:predicted amidohydrolase
MRIAVVQQDNNPGQVEVNRKKALTFAGEALARGADLILFHEELLIGYSPDSAALSEPVDGPTTRAFIDLLKGSTAAVVYGLTEVCGSSRYISAPVVTGSGVLANYRKTHLWWKYKGLREETAYYQPGDRLVTFDHQGVKIGIMICYDGDFPEMARSYAKMGCSVLLWMNNRTSRGYLDRVKSQAGDNSLYFAVSCCCGTDELGQHCGGGSNITDYQGRLLAEIWDVEGIICADIEPGLAIEHRQENPWFRGLRPELYL